MLAKEEIRVLRSLGQAIHEIANQPSQQEKIRLWTHLNDLDMIRPMVAIGQLPWHELDFDGSLTCQVQDPFWRSIENEMRQSIYQYRHLPADMVLEDCIGIPMAIHDSGYGLAPDEKLASTDPQNDVMGHAYRRQIADFEDILKLTDPVVTHDRGETERRMAQAHEIFDGIISVRPAGGVVWFGMWDRLIEIMGVTETLVDLMDRPEFIHAVCRRWTEATMHKLDQYETLGLLNPASNMMHCTYTYNSTILPKSFSDGSTPAKACWTMGMAQIFSNVSPAMNREFELEYCKDFYRRFGFVNYGCCEPLHDRIDDVLRYIPNARKISVSPWAKVERCAEQIGKRAVLTRKPNPVYVSAAGFMWDDAEKEIKATLKAARDNGCAVEFVLKDVSSVGYKPENLFAWEKNTMELVKSW